MRIIGIVSGIFGIWFLASALTENGLLPSRHGSGRTSEVIEGIIFLAFAGFVLFRNTKN
jgi:hypothetical protein